MADGNNNRNRPELKRPPIRSLNHQQSTPIDVAASQLSAIWKQSAQEVEDFFESVAFQLDSAKDLPSELLVYLNFAPFNPMELIVYELVEEIPVADPCHDEVNKPKKPISQQNHNVDVKPKIRCLLL